MAMSALSCSLTADPSGLRAASPPFSCWDLMHSVQLTRLLMGSMEIRRVDADAQVGWVVLLGCGESVGRGEVWEGRGNSMRWLLTSEDGFVP